jgi:hypothetical protein
MKTTMIIAAALLLTSVAAAQDVSYNFDQQAEFARYKTYRWVEMPGGVKLDDLMAKQLKSAFDSELAKKGLTQTDSETADLYVGYQAAIGQEKQLTSYNTGWGYGPGWRYGGGGMGMTTSTTSTILVGSVAFDMYEAPKKELVWRGIATKTLDTKAKPEKRANNINKAVAKLLKNYPPKKK